MGIFKELSIEIDEAMPFSTQSVDKLFHSEQQELPVDLSDDIDNEERLRFIWGIKSYDDIVPGELSIYSMTDIDIVYDTIEEKYLLGVETIYNFKDGVYGSREYIRELLQRMTEWMDEMGYDKSYKPDIFDVFTRFLSSGGGFESIEQVYGCFRFLAEKFCEGLPVEEGG